jgi:hypothetical protein
MRGDDVRHVVQIEAESVVIAVSREDCVERARCAGSALRGRPAIPARTRRRFLLTSLAVIPRRSSIQRR